MTVRPRDPIVRQDRQLYDCEFDPFILSIQAGGVSGFLAAQGLALEILTRPEQKQPAPRNAFAVRRGSRRFGALATTVALDYCAACTPVVCATAHHMTLSHPSDLSGGIY